MKKILATSAALALTLTVSQADQFRLYNPHHAPACSIENRYNNYHYANHGYNGYERNPSNLFLQRLSLAPRFHGCGGNSGHLGAIRNAAYSARQISHLGKIEYGTGASWLSYEAKYDIQNTILRSGVRCSPNSLIVVMGYADKSGCADANLRLSDKRASLVKRHIDHISWQNGLQLQTTTIAMGEEVELRNHGLHHNRVAEIWLVEFHRPVNQIISVVEPAAQTQVIAAPSQTISQTQVLRAPVQQTPNSTAVISQSSQVITQQNFAPAPQPQAFAPQNIAPAPQAATPAPQPIAPAPQAPVAPPAQAPQSVLPSAPATEIPVQNFSAPAPTQAPELAAAPAPVNPFEGLAAFLEQNVVLSNDADRSEFSKKLDAIKSLAAKN